MRADDFIRCWKALYFAVTRSIPCLKKIILQWQEAKRKTLGHCQRPHPRPATNPTECSERGKPISLSSCSSCVAWGEAVENVYYPQKSKGNIPWDNINPTCLARSHIMVAKAFISRLERKCTKLEDFDLVSLLEIMKRFKDFLGGERSTYDIFEKVNISFFLTFGYYAEGFEQSPYGNFMNCWISLFRSYKHFHMAFVIKAHFLTTLYKYVIGGKRKNPYQNLPQCSNKIIMKPAYLNIMK